MIDDDKPENEDKKDPKVVDIEEERKRRKKGKVEALWMRRMRRNEKGAILPTVDNVLIALEDAEELGFAFQYDLMARAVMVQGRLPAVDGQDIGSDREGPWPRMLADSDCVQVKRWLQRGGMPRIGSDMMHEAIDRRARDRDFHPIREWLLNLQWDYRKRIDQLFTAYFGCEDTGYSREIGRMFMISLVARVMEPGCQCDYMVILEGDQGQKKSRALKLLGDPWFSDTLPDIHHSREASQHLRGKWLVEISELAAIIKADPERFKSWVTRRVEIYLPRYAHNEVYEPRQFVAVGTTNKQDQGYLSDETGNRRVWPLKVGEIDLEWLEEDRSQLFAEAVVRYLKHKEAWWPTPELEATLIKPEQEARYVHDPWEEAVLTYGYGKEPEVHVVAGRFQRSIRVSISEVAREALGLLEKYKIGTREQRRIAAILVRDGWKAGHDGKQRFYGKICLPP